MAVPEERYKKIKQKHPRKGQKRGLKEKIHTVDTGRFRDSLSFSLLNHWKFQTYQISLPGFILHAVTGTNMFYKYLCWKPVKGPNTSALRLLTKSSLQLMYLENSFFTEDTYFAVLRSGISLFLPKQRVSSKLRLQNCYDTAMPEWKSLLLPTLPLYKNNYIPAEMSTNNWQSKSFHYFSSRTVPWYKLLYSSWTVSFYLTPDLQNSV